MIQQLIEIRNNILSAIEANDNILAKMYVNKLDTLLNGLNNQQEKMVSKESYEDALNMQKASNAGYESKIKELKQQLKEMYSEKEVKHLIHLACSHSGIQVFKGFDKWFDKNKK
jgi:hypothetical protein